MLQKVRVLYFLSKEGFTNFLTLKISLSTVAIYLFFNYYYCLYTGMS